MVNITDVSEQVVVPQPQPTKKRLVNADTGIQTIKGGQSADEPLIDSVIQAYANLVNSPVDLFFFATLLFMLMAELNKTEGPLEIVNSVLTSYSSDNASTSPFLAGLARFFSTALSLLTDYKPKIISVGFMWVPYIAKPSTNNAKISGILTILLLFRKTDLLADLVLSQLYFLYTQLRNPKFRFALMVLALVLFVFGLSNVSSMVKVKDDVDNPGIITPSRADGNPNIINPKTPTRTSRSVRMDRPSENQSTTSDPSKP